MSVLGDNDKYLHPACQISSYSYLDPISGEDYLLDPVVKIAICLGVLFSSLILLMQCVRLSVHLTFLLRAVSTDPSRHRRLQKLAFAINRRASLYFSLGLRVQYSFFPLFLYILGPLALLISTIVEVS